MPAPRVLLVALGTRGDVEPFVRLGTALVRSGAEVRVAVLADGEGRVRAAGLEAVVVGPAAPETLWGGPGTGGRELPGAPLGMYLTMRRSLAASATPLASGLTCPVRWADRAVVGLAAARLVPVLVRVGVPARLALMAPVLPHPGGSSTWTTPAWAWLPAPVEAARQEFLWRLTQDLSAELARRTQEALGAPTAGRARRRGTTGPDGSARPLLATSRVVDPCPSASVEQTGWWADPAPRRPLPREVSHFLERRPPPLLLALGSLPAADPEARVRTLARVAADLGRPAVVQVSGAAAGPRPYGAGSDASAGEVLVVGEIDHRVLLPRVAAVVHHGGSGTTHAALAAGRPQVVLPHLGDQPHLARQVQRLGVAPAPLPAVRTRGRAGHQQLVQRVRAVLQDDRFGEAARRAAASMEPSAEGLDRAVAAILG